MWMSVRRNGMMWQGGPGQDGGHCADLGRGDGGDSSAHE